jgi:hypothetical protein
LLIFGKKREVFSHFRLSSKRVDEIVKNVARENKLNFFYKKLFLLLKFCLFFFHPRDKNLKIFSTYLNAKISKGKKFQQFLNFLVHFPTLDCNRIPHPTTNPIKKLRPTNQTN